MKDKIKKLLNIIYKILSKNKEIIIMSVPLILMHVYIAIMAKSINFDYKGVTPIIFSASWIVLYIGITYNLKNNWGKGLYLLINILFGVLFLVNGVYKSFMSNFFDFNLIESASEGAPFILDALKSCNPFIYILFITILVAIYYGIKYYPKKEKSNYRNIFLCIILFLTIHSIAPFTLGKENKELSWSNWKNARNIYESFNDVNKSIRISGFLEFEVRNFYFTFLKSDEELKEEDLEFLNNAYSYKENEKNKYTGVLKDKNLIIVQLEGMDNWIINKEDTPTIYKMMNEGINFTNHFSFYNGGGSTFNSEFAINTGFVTPYSYNKNAYTFNKNAFPYSLANMFKAFDYNVNAFHMNTGEYYSRAINYKNWGYDAYNGLKDLGTYQDNSYLLDRELINNETFNELLFNEEKKFVDFIITYSGHMPFTNTKSTCQMLYLEDNPDITDEDFKEMSELECIKRQNRETDDMFKLLLENLEEKGLIDNTAIVVATDHYLYTVEDKTLLDKNKETSNNLINKTPFFIWYKGAQKTTIKAVTSQLNVLPTILNLYGMDYNPNNYIGEDALKNNYSGVAFFNDYSWYDGKVYVDGGVVTNGKKISNDDLEAKNYLISYYTRKNDLTLKYNYFGMIKNNKESDEEK